MIDPISRMLAGPNPCNHVDLIQLIAKDTDRGRLVKVRTSLLRRAKASDVSVLVWTTLLSRRIADLYRPDPEPSAMTIAELTDALVNGFPKINTKEKINE